MGYVSGHKYLNQILYGRGFGDVRVETHNIEGNEGWIRGDDIFDLNNQCEGILDRMGVGEDVELEPSAQVFG